MYGQVIHSAFLNRIALETMEDPTTVDPQYILQRIFEFAEPPELIELFDQFCICAMNEQYSWNEGGPGNLLFVCEQIEMFVEACSLLDKKTNEAVESFFKTYSLPQWKKEFHGWMEAAFADFSVVENVEPASISRFPGAVRELIRNVVR